MQVHASISDTDSFYCRVFDQGTISKCTHAVAECVCACAVAKGLNIVARKYYRGINRRDNSDAAVFRWPIIADAFITEERANITRSARMDR